MLNFRKTWTNNFYFHSLKHTTIKKIQFLVTYLCPKMDFYNCILKMETVFINRFPVQTTQNKLGEQLILNIFSV